MAGQPKKRAMIEELERLTREEFGDGPETVLDFAAHWVASGKTLTDLAEQLSQSLDVTIYRARLSRFLNDLDDKELLGQAREEGGHALAEHAMTLARDVPERREDIAKAKLRMDAEFWLAARWNRRELGEQKSHNVAVVSLGQLHLEALKAYRPQQIAAEVISPEVGVVPAALPSPTDT